MLIQCPPSCGLHGLRQDTWVQLRLGLYTLLPVYASVQSDVLMCRCVCCCGFSAKDTWVRMRMGLYKEDLAKVVDVDYAASKATIHILHRLDFQAMANRVSQQGWTGLGCVIVRLVLLKQGKRTSPPPVLVDPNSHMRLWASRLLIAPATNAKRSIYAHVLFPSQTQQHLECRICSARLVQACARAYGAR